MNNFTFQVTTDIRFGKDRLNELPEVLNTFGKKCPIGLWRRQYQKKRTL